VGPTTDAFYLKFYEFGTKQRKRKSGASTGRMPAKPFIERTHRQEAPKIIRYIVNNYDKMVTKYLEGRARYMNRKLQKFKDNGNG
jgi:HK97 gp10 family phage protein